MQLKKEHSTLFQILTFSVSGIILSYFGLSFLSLIPVQMLFHKKGIKAFIISALIIIVAQIVISLDLILQVEEGQFLGGFPIDAAITFTVALVLLLKNSGYFKRFRTYEFFGICSVIVGMITLPIFIGIFKQPEIIDSFVGFFDTVLKGLFGSEDYQIYLDLANDGQGYSLIQLVNDSLGVFMSTYLLFFYLLISSTWWIGSLPSRRTKDTENRWITQFKVKDQMVWMFLIPLVMLLGIIFLDVFGTSFQFGPFIYVLGNITAIMCFLYFLQGYSILQFLMKKKNIGIGLQTIFRVVLLILLFWPGVNLFIIGCFVVFGVLELWIKFRTFERS